MTDNATPATAAPETAPAPAAPSTDAAAITARDQELTQLYESDPNRYFYEDGGRHANEHVALRKAQQAAEKAVAQQAEGDETDDADADAIDLDLPAEASEDEDDEEAEVGEMEASSSDEAVGVDSYTPPAIEGVSWADDALKPIIGVAARHGISEVALSEALSAYGEVIQQQQARLAEADKAANKASEAELTKRLGSKEAADAYVATAREAARLMPESLREALKAARLPDGRKVAHLPELTEFLHAVASKQADAAPAQHAVAQDEVARLDTLMRSNIDAYRTQPWENSGMTGSQRMLQLRRQMAGEGPKRPSQAQVDDEERRLVKLSRTDPQMFQFGSWPGARSPADRLHAIRTRRA